MANPRKALCPHCRLPLSFEPAQAGKAIDCPYCQQRFLLPRLAPEVEKPPPAEPRAFVPPSRFFVPPADPEFAVPLRSPPMERPPPPRRRDGSNWDASGATARTDWPDDELLSEPEPVSRSEARAWHSVASGLGLIQAACVLGTLALILVALAVGPQLLIDRSITSNIDGSRRDFRDFTDLLCSSGGCLGFSLLLAVFGQAMTLSIPRKKVRTAAVVSFILLLIGFAIFVLQVAVLVNTPTYAGPASQDRGQLPGVALGILGSILLVAAHLLFVIFLQDVAAHLRSRSTSRQVSYYLAFYLIFLALGVVVFFLAVSQTSYRSQAGPSSYYNSGLGMGYTCWSCYGLFLTIALLSVLQKVRSLIRARAAGRATD